MSFRRPTQDQFRYNFVTRQKETHCYIVWESELERYDTFKMLYLLWGQGNVQGLHISHQVFNFPATNDGENIGCFLHQVCDGD